MTKEEILAVSIPHKSDKRLQKEKKDSRRQRKSSKTPAMAASKFIQERRVHQAKIFHSLKDNRLKKKVRPTQLVPLPYKKNRIQNQNK